MVPELLTYLDAKRNKTAQAVRQADILDPKSIATGKNGNGKWQKLV
jgi:hypothetical protein